MAIGGKGSGKGGGGKRDGAGRPVGARDTLPRGSVQLFKSIRESRDAARDSRTEDPDADEAEGVLFQVMRGQIRYLSGIRLSAANAVLTWRRGKPATSNPDADKGGAARQVSWTIEHVDGITLGPKNGNGGNGN